MKKKGLWLSCICLLCIGLLALFDIGEAKAARKDWKPDKISIINTMAPGGGVDRRSRPIASQMEKILGIPVTVENKKGSGGAVGTMFFEKNMPKDGSSMMVHWQMPFSGGIIRKVPYTIDDFAVVGGYTTIVNGLHVHNDSPFKTFVDFIDYVKKNPNEVSLGFIVGATDHMIARSLIKTFDLKVREVTYNGGGPSRAALAGKHIDAAVLGSETTWAALGKDARTLVLFTEERNVFNPDVPTIKDVVKKDFPQIKLSEEMYKLANWHFFATHAEVRDKYPERFQLLADTLKQAVESEEIKKLSKEQYWVPKYEGPEVAQEKMKWVHNKALEFKDLFIKK